MTPAEIGNKYDVLEKLADGGMGQIFKVRHRHLDQIQAIKVLSEAVEDATARKRFFKEARHAAQLRHPNIVQLIDFEVPDSGNAYIVMEFIDGVTLAELVERSGPPVVPVAMEIARQALDALSYLHDQELIHRDVATDNFMLTRGAGGQLVVKLIDLGIAKSLSSESAEQLTAAATFLGKARYTAPEQFKEQGARHLTKASDVYSFGVVLYELLTGRSPIQGNDLAAIFASHLFEPPLGFELSDPDRRVPPELRALVLRALEKDPAARFESAGAMLAELRCCYDTPVSFADADGVLAAHAAHAAHAAAGGRGGESGNEADGEEDPDRRAYRDLSEATAPSGAGPALKSAVRPRREATTGVAAAAAPASAASQPLAGGVAEPASRQDLIDRLEALPTRELEGGAQDRMTETVILRSSAPSARGPKLLPWIIAAVVLTLLVAAFLLSRG